MMRARDSKPARVITKDPKSWWIREPLNPPIVTLYVPTVAVAFVKIFIAVLAVPPGARKSVAGETPNVTPAGTDGTIPSDI